MKIADKPKNSSETYRLFIQEFNNLPYRMSYGIPEENKYWVCYFDEDRATKTRDYLIKQGLKIDRVERYNDDWYPRKNTFRFLLVDTTESY